MNENEDALCCPNCGSTTLNTEKKGFGTGKFVAGTLIAGPLAGILFGGIGRNNRVVYCLQCGKKFKAGSLTTVKKYKEQKALLERMTASGEANEALCGCCGVVLVIIGIIVFITTITNHLIPGTITVGILLVIAAVLFVSGRRMKKERLAKEEKKKLKEKQESEQKAREAKEQEQNARIAEKLATMTVTCTDCGTKVNGAMKFCPHCGAKIEIKGPFFCPQCEAEIPSPDMKFCIQCGALLSDESPVIKTPQASTPRESVLHEVASVKNTPPVSNDCKKAEHITRPAKKRRGMIILSCICGILSLFLYMGSSNSSESASPQEISIFFCFLSILFALFARSPKDSWKIFGIHKVFFTIGILILAFTVPGVLEKKNVQKNVEGSSLPSKTLPRPKNEKPHPTVTQKVATVVQPVKVKSTAGITLFHQLPEEVQTALKSIGISEHPGTDIVRRKDLEDDAATRAYRITHCAKLPVSCEDSVILYLKNGKLHHVSYCGRYIYGENIRVHVKQAAVDWHRKYKINSLHEVDDLIKEGYPPSL